MTNGEIASIFTTIGKILELQGENPFRVRAYDRAALTIGALPRDLADVYAEGGRDALQEIPGIGEDLSQKIEELLTTGKLACLSKLQANVPPGLLEIMQIPGMGPKKTKIVWEKFDVETIDDLKKLLASGKLQKLKGWGEKSVANILQGIGQKESLGTRTALHEALAAAQVLIAQLKRTKLCTALSEAGSLRRRRETIGDIDILAASTKPEQVINAFCALPAVARVISRGPTKSSVLLGNGMQVDLRVLEPEVFGAALHYFTGSKQHNIHVRTMGIKKGITISEYGVFKGTAEKKGKLLASKTEEDVFRAAGLPYIPPEIREDRGEIEAALAGKLPTLIEPSDIRGDLHMHSTFSDGSESMVDMATAAKKAGREYIAITDHASAMGMVRGIKTTNVKEYLAMVEEARKKVKGIHILAGTEVDILADGSLYLPDSVLAQFDWVVASVHGKFNMTREEMTERLLRAIRNPHVRVLGHPTARLLLQRVGIEFDADKVFREAAVRGVALELNASVYRLDLDDVHCKRAKDLGAKIAIGTDAHHSREFDMAFGISQARRGWLEKTDVVNALPWKEFSQRYLR